MEDTSEYDTRKHKRKRFAFLLIFPRVSSQEDKEYLNTVMVFVSILSIGILALGYPIDGWRGVAIAATTILLSSITGAVFSLLDRMGVAAPIEGRLTTLVDSVDKQTAFLEKVTEEVLDYTKYSHARKRFGLSDVRGELLVKEDGNVDIKRGADEFAIKQFEAAQPGALIRYMNTFLEDESKYYYAIKDAMERGVNIRLMMINPHANSAAFINRYTDCLKELYEYQSKEEISEMVTAGLRKLEGLTQLRERLIADGKSVGDYEIRFYDRSMNFPMMIITEPGKRVVPHDILESSLPDVAYTGFYGRISSESMPYIEWRGGQFRAIQRFAQMFDDKWAQYKGTSLKGGRS